MSSTGARISAVVVAYHSADVIADCLESIRGADEIIVVDNASADHTCEAVRHACPSATLIANPENRGFAAAVNQGVQRSSGELILLLNPDVRVLTPLDGCNPMAEQASEPQYGVVGGRLQSADGRVQRGFAVRAFPTPWTLAFEVLLVNRLWSGNPVNRRYRVAGFDWELAQDCDQPAGAFMMFRREVYDAVEGFDEGFFPLWFEDVDFCLRVRRAGFRNRYEPAAKANHVGAHSLSAVTLRERQKSWYGSLLRFVDKHYSPVAAIRLRKAAAAGLFLRGVFASLGSGREQRLAYFEAMRTIRAASPGDADAEQVRRLSGLSVGSKN